MFSKGSKRFWFRVNGSSEINDFEGRTASISNSYDGYGNVTVRTTNNNNVENSSTTTVLELLEHQCRQSLRLLLIPDPDSPHIH